ncbi:MAG: glycosyltransferase, partial [Candidatus Staskawiczbacteria bacterium]|nr:glycosyltransferase [Candidatus Staskawiczbacteria bacterium]
MKILVISPYIPWPLYSGSSVRIFNLSKQMSLKGHKVFLLFGQNNEAVDINIDFLNFYEKIYTYKIPTLKHIFFIIYSVFSPKIYPAVKFQSNNFKEVLNNILSEEKIDVIWACFSFMADMLPDYLNKKMPVILDQHESERLVYYGYLKNGNLKQKIFAIINILKLKKFEEKVFSKINILVSVSKEESIVAHKYVKQGIKFLTVPNGVDESFFTDLNLFLNKKDIVVFCANMAVRRNIEAANWFVKRIFPNIKEKIPDV